MAESGDEHREERLQLYNRAYPRLQLLKKRSVPLGVSAERTRQYSSGSNWSQGSRDDGDPEDAEGSGDESDQEDDPAEVEATRECRAFIPELDNMNTFQDWLDEWPPSSLQSHPDGIKYLIVLSPERFHGDLAPADIVGLADGWETLKNSGRTIGEDVISEMAQTHRMLGGKWMMYPRTRTLSDMFWSVIAPAVVSGKLTESCVAAKISGPGTNRRSTLCVYMNDFTNFEKIKELERAIRALKFKCDMRFKADIYSQLGIYGPNCGDYNVHDRLYESHFVLSLEEEHRSMIIRP